MTAVDPRYPLRPEIVESTYYLYRYTKDPKYLEMGKTFFEDLKKYCRTDGGYTVLKSVVTKEKGDLMPSYFLAETLKYLYLLFSPEDKVDFDRVVFNTEAHPLFRTWERSSPARRAAGDRTSPFPRRRAPSPRET